MEKSDKIKRIDTYEPQALRKAEISRILNTVKDATFNAKENRNSSNNNSFKKRSLLDIALDTSSSSEVSKSSSQIEVEEENKSVETTIDEDDKIFPDPTDKVNEQKEIEDNFDEENKRQLIEDNNALIEERIKNAQEEAFEKGKQEGLKEGHNNGISEARAQSQEGLDAAISIFRIAAETIDNSDQANLEILNDTLQNTIIEIAQQSAGFMIDEFPQKFVQRINEFSKDINENFKKISLEINHEDYESIKSFIQNDDFLLSINFKVNNDLLRGDMRLNADGIRVEDFMKYRTSNFIGNLNKPYLENISDETVKQDTDETQLAPSPENTSDETVKQDTDETQLAPSSENTSDETVKQDTVKTQLAPSSENNSDETVKQDTDETQLAPSPENISDENPINDRNDKTNE